MTGAGGIIHANFMYQAKPDGLIIGNNAGGLILQQIMGAKGIEFDGKSLSFSGFPVQITTFARSAKRAGSLRWKNGLRQRSRSSSEGSAPEEGLR